MKLKYNFGILKNKKIGFHDLSNENSTPIVILINDIKMVKDNIRLISEKSYIDIDTFIFNSLKIRKNDDIIWLIYDKNETNIISGFVGFSMCDTYGFPIEITQEILSEKNQLLDMEGFNILYQLQKEKSSNTFKNKSAF
jgi:alanyl-tRNA synthetase